MQFIVLGYDGTDEGALDRRMVVREEHLKQFREKVEQGTFLFGSALLDDDGKMVGSLIVCEFPSREALEQEWLASEPYKAGNVWQKIEIIKTMVPPFLVEKLQRGP
jgi:uncharacterized protein